MEKSTYLQIRKQLDLSNRKGMFAKHVLTDVVLVMAMVAWIQHFKNSPWLFMAPVGVVVLMFRSFAMMHEAVHGVATKDTSNDWWGIFYGGIALLAFEPWKKAHLEHHYWSGNAKKDPVMALLLVYPKFPKWLTRILNISWKNWIPTLGVLQHGVFWILSFKGFLSSPRNIKTTLSMIWPVLFWSSMCAFLPSTVLLKVFVPGILLYLITVEIVNLPHHLMLPQHLDETRLAIWEQYESARSCIYPRWMARFVTLNFNYHTEHHMFPDAPWYHLDSLHDVLKGALKERLNIDDQFAWIVKNRKESLDQVMAAALEESNLTRFRKPMS